MKPGRAKNVLHAATLEAAPADNSGATSTAAKAAATANAGSCNLNTKGHLEGCPFSLSNSLKQDA